MENTRRICKAPHRCVFALPRPGIPQPFPVPRPGKPVTQTKSVSALHFLVASASPNGFCKVFPVDLADSLCWHVAKSVQNIMMCWPQPGLSFVFVWPLKKSFFFPNQGHGDRMEEEGDEGKNIDRVKNIEYYFCFKDRNVWGWDAAW